MLSAFFCLVNVLFASLIPDARGQCRRLRFTIGPIHGQRLENHVIRTIDAISENFCKVKCLLEPSCVSYNFKTEANTGGKHECELNNASFEHNNEHSGDLVKKENYVYRGAENACAEKPCQNNSTCQAGFTDRYYQCLCISGFTGHDCEVDVNECTKGTHNCDVNAVCNNTQGSYYCTCKDGFHGDGKTCKDIDECTNGTHICDVNAVCNNTRGSYNCTCKDGFHGNGINCTDVDECANGKHSCDVNAVCNNTQGSYNCTCKDGFRRDGINCRVIKGLHSNQPGHSCKDIRNSGDSKGDGEYWIDPEKGGHPFKVYCDMTTDGGGWLLVSNVVIDSPSSPQMSVKTSYREISSYHNNQTFLTKSAMNELRTHLSFTQLRFHCSKQQGRTFHVTTVANSSGEAVVQYFSGQTDVQPDACGSFVRMENDNSKLAGVCSQWGFNGVSNYIGKWGVALDQARLYNHAAFVTGLYHWLLTPGGSRWDCDDSVGVSSGDFWKVFVR